MGQENLTDKLEDILNLVNDWLKFAEAKNAILLSACGLALWSLIRLVSNNNLSQFLSVYFSVLLVFLLASMTISLLSFWPNLKTPQKLIHNKNSKNGNLLYFGYLALISKDQLLSALSKATNAKENSTIEIHTMYAEQIITNSKITLAKYKLFGYAVKTTICGLIISLLPAVFSTISCAGN